MKKLALILLFWGLGNGFAQQIDYFWFDSIKVVSAGDTLRNAWSGGLENPQFSAIDLNSDGLKDILIFDRLGDKILPFVASSAGGNITYTFNFDLIDNFPPDLSSFVMGRDFNCDGKADLFTYTAGGFKVYKNITEPGFSLQFQPYVDRINATTQSGLVNLYTIPNDYSSIEDMDDDGDLDILTFGAGSSQTVVEYYRNTSIENYGTCDSLEFVLDAPCWGSFMESITSDTLTLGIPCRGSGGGNSTASSRHSGSTLLAIDLDNDADKDLLLGDVSSKYIKALKNDGDVNSATINTYVPHFPAYDTAIYITDFPAVFSMDVNNDGVKDLIAAPNSPYTSENVAVAWLYENTNTNDSPLYVFQQKDFIANTMIDHGNSTKATFFDENKDGKMDMLVGNFGYFLGVGNFQSQLALYRNISTATTLQYELITKDYGNFSSLQMNGMFPACGDLDNDGDFDLIVGDAEGKLHYFEDTATANNPTAFVLKNPEYASIDVGSNAMPQLIDLDRDGLLDLAIGEKNGVIEFYKNTGTAVKAVFSSTPTIEQLGNINIGTNFSGYTCPFFAEFDSTGNYYLVIADEDGKLGWYNQVEGNLTGTFYRFDELNVKSKRITVAGADLDNNGRIELIVGHESGGLSAYRKEGIAVLPSTKDSEAPRAEVTIFPNPSKGSITIESTLPISQVLIYDCLGRVLVTETPSLSQATITLEYSLSNGYYIVIVADTFGNRAQQKICVVKE